jgi:hypothetical protein
MGWRVSSGCVILANRRPAWRRTVRGGCPPDGRTSRGSIRRCTSHRTTYPIHHDSARVKRWQGFFYNGSVAAETVSSHGTATMRRLCGLFSACFQAIFGSFANADRRVPDGDTHARECDGASMGPFCATSLNPRRRPSRTVPVKLPPSPDTRQLGMGPILGLRFFAHDRPLDTEPGGI